MGKRVLKARPAVLAGRTVRAVEARGKHLLIGFADGLVLHTHMRMTGAWRFLPPGQAWNGRIRAFLECEDVTAVCFGAPLVEVVREGREGLQRLGPDLLAAEIDLSAIVARARSAGSPPLGELLLDQRVAAGIGNIHRCEALWRCRLDPWRTDYSDADLERLYEDARAGLKASVAERRPRAAVYGRTGRPCPRCGASVRSRQQGLEAPRRTYWCPGCQS